MHIYLYDRHSESGLALKDALRATEIVHENSRFRGTPQDFVVNWGCSELPRNIRLANVINTDVAVYRAINKYRAFQVFEEKNVPHVPFITSVDVVRQWLADNGRVYARTRVAGFDGDGLVELHGDVQDIPPARLYTLGVPIRQEYRVTVFRSPTDQYRVIAAQRKVKADTADRTTSDTVRTSANGWGFKLIDHERYLPQSVATAAISALSALRLDFGGVDVVYLPDESARVLEVNTAPQLTPTVCRRLAAAIAEAYGNR